jgi:hypothetical protein
MHFMTVPCTDCIVVFWALSYITVPLDGTPIISPAHIVPSGYNPVQDTTMLMTIFEDPSCYRHHDDAQQRSLLGGVIGHEWFSAKYFFETTS